MHRHPAGPLRGGCACGEIRFEIASVYDCVVCHCDDCRKATGAPFSVTLVVVPDEFRRTGFPAFWSTTNGDRAFCRTCGTPVGYEAKDGSFVSIPLGILDDPTLVRPLAQQFWPDRLAWIEELAQVPRYSTNVLPPPQERAEQRTAEEH